MSNEREGKACWSERVTAKGTIDDPHGMHLEILFGSTLPDDEQQYIADTCVSFLQIMIRRVKNKYPNIETAGCTVSIANMQKDPDWEKPNVH